MQPRPRTLRVCERRPRVPSRAIDRRARPSQAGRAYRAARATRTARASQAARTTRAARASPRTCRGIFRMQSGCMAKARRRSKAEAYESGFVAGNDGKPPFGRVNGTTATKPLWRFPCSAYRRVTDWPKVSEGKSGFPSFPATNDAFRIRAAIMRAHHFRTASSTRSISSCRECTPSFTYTLWVCVRAVFHDTCNLSAI